MVSRLRLSLAKGIRCGRGAYVTFSNMVFHIGVFRVRVLVRRGRRGCCVEFVLILLLLRKLRRLSLIADGRLIYRAYVLVGFARRRICAVVARVGWVDMWRLFGVRLLSGVNAFVPRSTKGRVRVRFSIVPAGLFAVRPAGSSLYVRW